MFGVFSPQRLSFPLNYAQGELHPFTAVIVTEILCFSFPCSDVTIWNEHRYMHSYNIKLPLY